MRITFRQGIIKAGAGFLTAASGNVNLVVQPNVPVTVAVADLDTDYLINEYASVTSAWTGPFDSGTTYWLYWDINVKTGVLTRGYTTLSPVTGATAPATPAGDQHWFDTTTNTHKVWNSTAGRWIRVIRVFAAQLTGGAVLSSVSASTPLFTGTQIGSTAEVAVGALVFDAENDPIKRTNGTFLTTQTSIRTSLVSSAQLKIGAVILEAEAQSSTTAYSVVVYTDFDKFVPATTYNISLGLYGIVEQAASVGENVAVVIQGVVQNDAWDWSALNPGDPLYVTGSGALTAVQDGDAPAVATVVNTNTIIFRNATSNVVQSPVTNVPLSGSGSPEGVLTAVVGSLYTRTDGGTGTTLYVKETGTGNTGWVAK